MEEKKKGEVQVELDDVTAQGVYANVAMIGHSETEFVMDFIFLQPQSRKAKVRSRVITSPAHVRQLIAALQDNVARYEERFGKIKGGADTGRNGEPRVGFYH